MPANKHICHASGICREILAIRYGMAEGLDSELSQAKSHKHLLWWSCQTVGGVRYWKSGNRCKLFLQVLYFTEKTNNVDEVADPGVNDISVLAQIISR